MRKTIRLNDGWKFYLQEQTMGIPYPLGCEYEEFDDSSWKSVQVPHDYSIYGEFDSKNFGWHAWLPGGIGWYRYKFSVDTTEDKHFELQLDGAYRQSEIWINGNFIGGQKNGYFSSLFDLSSWTRAGENLLVIRTNNFDLPNCRWYTGSGIYRHAWLTITPVTRFNTWGPRYTTPEVSPESALIEFQAKIEGPQAKNTNVIINLFDAQGRKAAETSGACNGSYAKGNIKLPHPALWSPENPNLYTAIATLEADGKQLDQIKTTIGIRKIEFRKGEGFLLNEQPMKFKGVCLHLDGGPVGAAVPDQIWEQRLAELKGIGCNAIRTAHQPPSPDFLDICDRMGFLVMNEFCDKWEPPHYLDFMLHWKKDLADWIARDFNHPSVIMWSTGNENYRYPDTPYIRKHLKMIGEEVRCHDTTRPVMNALERGIEYEGGGDPEDYAKRVLKGSESMDFIGVNYGDQWYDIMLKLDPDALILGAENYDYITSTPTDRHTRVEYHSWLYVEKDPRLMGIFNWLGIDYLGEATNSKPEFLGSTSGLIDISGQAKPEAALYRSFWSNDPVVSIAVYRQDPDDMNKFGLWGWPRIDQHWHADTGSMVDIVTYTNCEEVELYLNNNKIGCQRLADISNRIMKWRLPFAPGRLEAVGYRAGMECARFAVCSHGEPVRMEAIPCHNRIAADGMSMAMVRVKLYDADGNICTGSHGTPITFEVNGAGKLECVHNGSMLWHGPFHGSSVPAHNGGATAYIRAGLKPGPVTIKATAPGLSGASCSIEIVDAN
jgi:beta-galactosidase